MKRTSSRVFVAIGCVSAVALGVPLVLYAWQLPTRQPHFTPRLLIEDEFPPVDRDDRALAAAKNERELRLDVQRLYAIASELKDEVNGHKSSQRCLGAARANNRETCQTDYRSRETVGLAKLPERENFLSLEERCYRRK